MSRQFSNRGNLVIWMTVSICHGNVYKMSTFTIIAVNGNLSNTQRSRRASVSQWRLHHHARLVKCIHGCWNSTVAAILMGKLLLILVTTQLIISESIVISQFVTLYLVHKNVFYDVAKSGAHLFENDFSWPKNENCKACSVNLYGHFDVIVPRIHKEWSRLMNSSTKTSS